MRRAFGVALVVACALVALGIAPARAQEPEPPQSVTFEASRTTMRYGVATRLYGKVKPPVADQEVQIVDRDGNVKKRATTDETGAYSVRFTPRRNVVLTAQLLGVSSDPVALRVRPRLRVGLDDVRLFGRALLRGRLAPAHPGQSVVVRLLRWGDVVAKRKVRLRDGRYFRTRIYVPRPGRYRATATFDDADHLAGRARSRRLSTPLPSLSPGSRSIFVKLLERRLVRLNYLLLGVDRRYDVRTADAMRAFNKVQRRARLGTVSESTWRALAKPIRPRPRYSRPRYHIEVDQTKQVVYRVRAGRVITIVHASTGRNGYTHDGAYRFFRQIHGYSGGRLYYPSYFDGRRAIHGWPEVPTYPASHGCVRIPMWSAIWVQNRISIGDRIFVYH